MADVDKSLGKCTWIFLGHVAANAFQNTVCISTGEFIAVTFSVCGRSVEIARNRKVGTVMTGPSEKLALHIVILRLTLGQIQPPAKVMRDDIDVIRIVE